jgi:hypothetical protein
MLKFCVCRNLISWQFVSVLNTVELRGRVFHHILYVLPVFTRRQLFCVIREVFVIGPQVDWPWNRVSWVKSATCYVCFRPRHYDVGKKPYTCRASERTNPQLLPSFFSSVSFWFRSHLCCFSCFTEAKYIYGVFTEYKVLRNSLICCPDLPTSWPGFPSCEQI